MHENADVFVEYYANDFLENDSLLKYSYNRRSKFNSNVNDSNAFGVSVWENHVKLHCLSRVCHLDEIFTDSALVLSKGQYILKPDSIGFRHSYDSLAMKQYSFKVDPLRYYTVLENLIHEYKIFGFYKNPESHVIWVYLSSEYYLIYNPSLESFKNKDDEVLKDYGNGWLYLKLSQPLDLG